MEYDYDKATEDWKVVIMRVNNYEKFGRGKLFKEFWNIRNNGSINFLFSEQVVNRYYFLLYLYFTEGGCERFSGVSGFDRYLVTEGVLNEL
jgi:hypothetical protein